MALTLSTLQVLQARSPYEAWQAIFDYVWDICTPEIVGGKPDAEVTRRDRAVGDLDLYMATAGWDLWASYETFVPRTLRDSIQAATWAGSSVRWKTTCARSINAGWPRRVVRFAR
ncbi:hypothetical protein LCGC14_3102060 [marine sediment metagenome]|uniref:Uncharacterized protein n=1 Tax=marine sediment metagenome TaxID=412755 RepID=A0A0F8W7F7_9ZZZZ